MSEQFDAQAWERQALAVWAAKEDAEKKAPQAYWKSYGARPRAERPSAAACALTLGGVV